MKQIPKWFKITFPLLIILLVIGFVFVKPYSGKEKKQSNFDDKGMLGRPLRVGIVPWPGYIGGLFANDGLKPNKGCIYWDNHKLLVEFVIIEDVDARAKAFAKGGEDGLDIVWTTIDFWASEAAGFKNGGVPGKAFIQVDWSTGGDAIVAGPSINSVKDLINKKVALASLTPSNWFYEYVLRDSLSRPEDISKIASSIVGKISSEESRIAFATGKVDAAVVWEPDVTAALQSRNGSKILISTMKYDRLLSDFMIAKEDFIKDHPDVIQAFVDGWFEGTESAKKDKHKTAQILMENVPLYKQLGEEVTLNIMSKVDLTDSDDNIKIFGLDGSIPGFNKLFREAGKVWLSRQVITDTISPTEAVTSQFIRKFVKSK